MLHESVVVGPFACNCHILADEKSKEAVVIDPGDHAEGILEVVRDLGVTVKTLLHTHCHLDHITGTRALKEATGARILIHDADRKLYEGLKDQYESTFRMFGMNLGDGHEPLEVDGTIADGDEIKLGGTTIRILHTPGHTPGSCCFNVDDGRERMLFSGDTLFQGSVGRTDLWGGDMDQEIASIRGKLFRLDDETLVYPGHGPPTRIEIEKRTNPFAGGASGAAV